MTEMYDKTSIDSIYKFANLVTGKSLSEVVTLPAGIENVKNRGDLGKMVEDFFFKHRPNNSSEPDFPEAGLELKTTGLLKDRKGDYRAKERLVLTQINYMKLASETWESSSLLRKCQLMLIMFYLYDNQVPVYDQKFALAPLLFRFPEDDLAQIRRDWEVIKSKVDSGNAHELSEGDTFYLSACRKGSGGPKESLIKQPFSQVGAKSRAFSLKASYMTKIIRGHSETESQLGVNSALTFEEATEMRFSKYLGMTVEEISNSLGYPNSEKNHKAFNRSLANRILTNGDGSVSELQKAGIQMKTLRLSSSGRLKESMSFKGFNYMDIVDEVWEESAFSEEIESKFLFVVFQIDKDDNERLVAVKYWNMPFEDREEVRRVWERTKDQVRVDARYLPRSTESRVAHVRPKAKNKLDTAITPQGEYLVKKAFWLNRSYIEGVVQKLI